MNNNIVTLVLIILISVSCTEDEKKFAEIINLSKETKVNLLESNTFPSLNLDNLTHLKKHSDSVSEGENLFNKVLQRKKSVKKVRKYLLNNTDLEVLCSSLFIEEVDYIELKEKCNEGPFDICPISFSDYKGNTKRIANQVLELIGEEAFSKTDCVDFINNEV